MSKRIQSGHYDIGRIEPKRDGPRPRRCGTFGVIRGDVAENNSRLEWSHICTGALKTTKWFAYRTGPGDNGKGTRTDLLKAFDSKSDAIEWVQRRYGNKFDREY